MLTAESKQKIIDFFLLKGVDIAAAFFILFLGYMVARWIGNVLMGWLLKRELEPPVRTLMVRIVRLLVMALTITVALQQLGMPIAPLIAGVSVAGLGVGLAMQGVLGNLIAGLLIIFTKPYRVGEYVEIVGVHGQVETIELFSTILVHPDRSRVVIPNRKIVGEILHNYGKIRQLNLTVGVAYATNLSDAMAVVRSVLEANPKILKDPAPLVVISEFADSSINISVKPWVALTDFGVAGSEIHEAVLTAFRARGIEIPFPQRDVHVIHGALSSAA
ncbi:MAG: mechanosensitive ion channel domain-containing protein [Verrucomicrobiota bacterium]